MCYPSVYAESCYRNSRSDVLEFFERFHHNKIKVKTLKIIEKTLYFTSLLDI